MSDSIDDEDDPDDPQDEWVHLHYPACSICSGTELLPGPVVTMAAMSLDMVPGKTMRFMAVVCMSCGYTIFVAEKFITPKPLVEGAENA